MATNYLASANTLPGHPRFLPGVTWYYPVVDSLDRTGAIAAFNADPARLSKLIPALPTPETGKVWRVKGLLNVADSGFWIGRNQAPDGSNGQISTYLDAAAGQSILSQLIAANGSINQAAYNFNPNGEPRVGVINPDRTGGLPKYAALHQNVPNGTYTVVAVTAAGVVLKANSNVIIGTATPNGSLSGTDVVVPPTQPGGGSGNYSPVVESYSGTFVPGIPTRKDRFEQEMTSYDPVTQRGVVRNKVTRNADEGRVFAFNTGSGWMSKAEYEALRFEVGVPYVVQMIERANSDTNPYELEGRQLQQGYYVAEHSFTIH